ncbi:MAG TPA: hypothetical protein VF263_02585 [Longimicrobiaceae bacterium]
MNLDTNHISDLVWRRADADVQSIVKILSRGDVSLNVCLFHVVELSAPTFPKFVDIIQLVRDLPIVLGNPVENIFDEELACACAAACGRTRRPPRVFARDLSEWGYVGTVQGTAVDLLEFYATHQNHRDRLISAFDYFSRYDRLKRDAAVVRDPMLPITLQMEEHLTKLRLTTPQYADALSAREVLDKVGGVPALPAYEIYQQVMLQRLTHLEKITSGNDLRDEYVACYTPYAAVTVLDRRTAHRVKQAKQSSAPRVTRYLKEVPDILQRIHDGQLGFVPSAW